MDYRIKHLREKKKLTQTELGKQVGVSRQYINALENGRAGNVSSKLLIKIAVVLECRVEDLVFLP